MFQKKSCKTVALLAKGHFIWEVNDCNYWTRGTNNQNHAEPTTFGSVVTILKHTHTHTNCLPVHTVAHKPSVCMTPPSHTPSHTPQPTPSTALRVVFSLARFYRNGMNPWASSGRLVCSLMAWEVALAKTQTPNPEIAKGIEPSPCLYAPTSSNWSSRRRCRTEPCHIKSKAAWSQGYHSWEVEIIKY